MSDTGAAGNGGREKILMEVHDLEIEAELWQGMTGWNASTLIEGRDYRVMGAASRDDAINRLTSNLLTNTEATFALGVKNRRYWSPNPYWKGK